MTDISAIRTEISEKVDAISGMRSFDFAAGTVTPPVGIVVPAGGQFLIYNAAAAGNDLLLEVKLIVANTWSRSAEKKLGEFLADSGASSIKVAVDGPGTAYEYAKCLGASNYGDVLWAGVQYFGADVIVEVKAS